MSVPGRHGFSEPQAPGKAHGRGSMQRPGEPPGGSGCNGFDRNISSDGTRGQESASGIVLRESTRAGATTRVQTQLKAKDCFGRGCRRAR